MGNKNNKGKNVIIDDDDEYSNLPETEKNRMIVKFIFMCNHENRSQNVQQILLKDVYEELTRGQKFYQREEFT